jgi:uncharacterized protein (TIGR03435 family)
MYTNGEAARLRVREEMLERKDQIVKSIRHIVRGVGYAAAVVALVLFSAESRMSAKSQSQNAAAQSTVATSDFSYDVASIRPTRPEGSGAMRIGTENTPDGFNATGVTVQILMQQAFNLQPDQLIGLPDWAKTQGFEIDAKMDGPTADALQKLGPDDQTAARRKMMQGLLADRFQLKVHHESRDLSVYFLTVGKGGLKMTEATPEEVAMAAHPPQGTPVPGAGRGGRAVGLWFSMGASGATINGTAAQLSMLIRILSQQLQPHDRG